MRKFFMAVLVLLCAVSFASTSFGAEKVLVYNVITEPPTIDPVLSNAITGSNVIFNIFEGLVRIGLDDKPEPGHAEKWDISADGMTWTFHLRNGLKWHDGKPMTAEDFRYGFIRTMEPEYASPYAHYCFFIKNAEAFYNGKAKAEEVGVKVIDDKTLVLELEYKFPLMLDYLSFHILYPARKDIVEKDKRGWTASAETIICNGPFYLSDWQHNSELTIKKNPHYWDAANVKLDAVRMVMINDANTTLAAFKSGKVDFTKNLPAALTQQLIAAGEAKVSPVLGTAFGVFNINKKPFDDIRVRKAFALAIDRKVMVEKVTMGGQTPALALIPHGLPGREPGQDFRQGTKDYLPERADVETAKKLLAEAGFPDGKGFPKLTYAYNTNTLNKSISEALQAMWKQNLGVEIELQNMEWKVFIDYRVAKGYDLARHAYIIDFFDAGSLLELWLTGVFENVVGYSNAEYDKLMKDSMKELDHAKRIGYMQKAEEILMNDMPIFPIYYYSMPYMESKRIKGVYQSPRNWEFFRAAEIVE